MTPPDFRPLLARLDAALRPFCNALFGADAGLTLHAPTPADTLPPRTDYVVLAAEGCAVALAAEAVPALLEAAQGTAPEAEDDALCQLASDAAEAVCEAFAADGLSADVPEFGVLPAEAPWPEAPWQMAFSMTANGHEIAGFALFEAFQNDADDPTVAPAAFPDLGAEVLHGDGADGDPFALLADVELEVTVELGRRRLPLADVMRLTAGSVIELEKLIGEPLEVYANGRLIAEGEAVVIDEQFGIRITRLMTRRPATRS